jgi:predicted Zn-dependent protease
VLGGGTLALVIALAVAVFQLADVLGPYVPFEWERAVSKSIVVQSVGDDRGDRETERRLQNLADRLAGAMELPEGLDVTVHYVKSDVINAVATLGGNIIVYDGLLSRMPNENALAMVLAHEIAHVKERHVIRAMSGGLLFSAVASALFGNVDFVAGMASGSGILTSLHYSRAREREADREALPALLAVYGHVGGFADMFSAMAKKTKDRERPPLFLSTHPLDAERWRYLHALARKSGWPVDDGRKPLK